MEDGYSYVFIDAPGLLWEKDAKTEQGTQIKHEAMNCLMQFTMRENILVVLLIENQCPYDTGKLWSILGNANKVEAILQATTPRNKAAEIVKKIDRIPDVRSFVIFNAGSLSNFFPMNVVSVWNGKLDDKSMQQAENILSRTAAQENYFSHERGEWERRTMYQGGPRKVIFLDVDGVLNADNGGEKIEEQYVRRLAHIVEETGAEIVLSSSWRYAYTGYMNPEQPYSNNDIELLIAMLEKYHLRILDTTADLTSGAYARPLEIRLWIQEQADLERFVILDDEIFWAWNWLADYFVCTTHLNDKGKCVYGMTDEDAEKAIEILNRPLVKYSF